MAALRESRDQMARQDEILRKAQRMSALGTLATRTGHEFQKFLDVIRKYSEFLARDLGPGHASAEDVTGIREGVERGQAYVREMLDFSRSLPVQREVLELASVLAKSRALLKPLMPPGVRLEFEAPPRPVEARVDRIQVEEIVLNLVSNARDAMPKGGLIRLSLQAGNGKAILLVQDSGLGMDEAVLRRIFELFFTTKKEGTGLGLAIVKDLVEENGGTIRVKSHPGEGTVFEVEFPLA
jgi:signal transduction histidine kinase